MTTLTKQINKLTGDYNKRIGAMNSTFKLQSSSMRHSEKRQLKRTYSDRYYQLVNDYKQDRRRLFDDYARENPQWQKSRRLWGWLFVVGAILAVVCCGASLPNDEEQPSVVATRLAENQEQVLWNVENIPIPYLQDSTQYVSNPDHILSLEAVDEINKNMKRIEQDFDIQSVVIVVNHIENDDPFRLAQDVGNRYGVGNNNRGLIVVVGYGDHKINMSPGRALEADLTDAECRQLQQKYVIPGMKAEMPDSAMVYLSEGLYAHLKGKELPQMSSLLDTGDDDAAIFGSIGLCTCFLIGWFILFVYKNKEYYWMTSSALVSLAANPFVEVVITSGGGFHGGGGQSFGGGGFSSGSFGGGHFGGGSFGGGGATSSW